MRWAGGRQEDFHLISGYCGWGPGQLEALGLRVSLGVSLQWKVG